MVQYGGEKAISASKMHACSLFEMMSPSFCRVVTAILNIFPIRFELLNFPF